jgi:hypothetical protein
LRSVQASQNGLGVAKEELSWFGKRNRPRSTWAMDEALADDPLQRGDLLAHRRLRVAKTIRRPMERALEGDRLKSSQMAQIDLQPMISFCNHIQY